MELTRLHIRAKALQCAFNNTSPLALKEQQALLKKLLRKLGENNWIEPSFHCDYGIHIDIGDDVFINMNCTFLDGHRIVIGDRVYLDVQGLSWVSRQDDLARAVVLFGDRIPDGALHPQGTSRSLTEDSTVFDTVLNLAERIGVVIVAGKI
ncbi:hypothetical protein M1D99_12545 [Pseudomonas sp. R3-41]